MTKEQFEHYIKGGLFKATYKPIGLDISDASRRMAGSTIEVNQNVIVTPIQSPEKWKGQHCFNSPSINGWLPEEDITIIEMIDEFIDFPEVFPMFMYRLTYTEESQIKPNFGNLEISLPLVVHREYSTDNDNYVLKLSNPQATRIEKAKWIGGYNEEPVWKEMKL